MDRRNGSQVQDRHRPGTGRVAELLGDSRIRRDTMAKQTLPVNFKDDILDPSMSGKRKYRLIDNGDGTVSFEDVTDYTQTGSDFGAGQINATNKAVNESCDKADVIDSLDDVIANQSDGMIAGAKAVAELNGNIYAQKVLWSGAVFLNSGQTISLSEKISDQKSGVMIVFSRYDNGAQNYGWQTAYISKYIVEEFPATGGWTTPLINASGTVTGNKYYYVSDGEIKGSDSNADNNNRQWVFRYVIGV